MRKRVRTDELRVGMFVVELCGPWLSHPFWKTRFHLDAAALRILQESGVQECWIDVSKGPDVGSQAPAIVVSAPPPPPPPPPVAAPAPATPAPAPRVTLAEELERAAGLTRQARQIVSTLYADARMGKALEVERCLPLVDEVANSVLRHPGAFVSLSRLKTRDGYTYMHSVAVCALMIALSRSMGLDEGQTREAGFAGLLHDVGKATVPLDLLQKPGKLETNEMALLRLHPERGHALLEEGGEASEAALDVCLHHHERWDGKGYPKQIAGEHISMLARMGAVCDVYDAITSNRPYKSAWDPAESLSRMAEWQGQFDKAVFHALVRVLGIYPVGSLVRLQSGRLAVVLEHNPERPLLPRVRAFFSTKSGMPITPLDIDLAAPSCQDRIVGRESNKNWNFPHLEELWAGRETLLRLGKT